MKLKNQQTALAQSSPLLSQERTKCLREKFLKQIASWLGIFPGSKKYPIFMARFSYSSSGGLKAVKIANRYNMNQSTLANMMTTIYRKIEREYGTLTHSDKGKQSYDLIWNKLFIKWLEESGQSYANRRTDDRRKEPAPEIDIKQLLKDDITKMVSISSFDLLDSKDNLDPYRNSDVCKFVATFTKAFYQIGYFGEVKSDPRYFFRDKKTGEDALFIDVARAALSYATGVETRLSDGVFKLEVCSVVNDLYSREENRAIREIIRLMVEKIWLDYEVGIDRRGRKKPKRQEKINYLLEH